MSVITAKCPNCGATMQLDNERTGWLCSYCGSKVKVEEAQKLLIHGIVKFDSSDELSNLYQVARRAKDSNNNENAYKYYDMILVKDPDSWEANFYVVYYQSIRCKIGEIWIAAPTMSNCVQPVLDLIKKNTNKEDQNRILEEIFLRLNTISLMFFLAARSHYDSIDLSIRMNYAQDYCNNASASAEIMYNFGNLLDTLFDSQYGRISAEAWESGIKIHLQYIGFLNDKKGNCNLIKEYMGKIKKYNPTYEEPNIKISTPGGCYVATAVYGSYNCPEVRTLRRFRDYTLSITWYGRAFIHIYYSISPSLVKWFGKSPVFKKAFKPLLDNVVNNLYKCGYKSTSYEDMNYK